MLKICDAESYVKKVLLQTQYGKSLTTETDIRKNSCSTIKIDIVDKRIINVDLNSDSLRWQFIFGLSIPENHSNLFRKERRDGWRSITMALTEANTLKIIEIINSYIRNLKNNNLL